jgi:hypothetical protein
MTEPGSLEGAALGEPIGALLSTNAPGTKEDHHDQ